MTQDFDQTEPPAEGESTNSVSIREIWNFVIGAARRHKLLCVISGVAVAVLGVTIALVLPPMYGASSKILITQAANITPLLSNPTRASLMNVDPMRGVVETIKQRENLEAIVKQAKLDEEWERTRSPVLKLKDSLMAVISGPLPEEEKIRALVSVLDNRMNVRTENPSIRIEVYWGDKQMAKNLTKLTQDRFLAARRDQETSVITAAIEILEQELKRASENIEPQLKAVEKARETALKAAGIAVPSKTDAPPTPAPAPTPHVVARPRPAPAAPDPSISARLTEIRQAIRNAQEPWQRRLTELKLQLSDLRGVYGPQHPAVVQQESRIREASAEPPELAELKQREHSLLAQLESAGTSATSVASIMPRPRIPGTPEPSGPSPTLVIEDSAEVAAARSKLMNAVEKYHEITRRMDAARIELTTAETAFRYRYVVVAHPEIPRKPVKPNRPILIVGSIIGALLLGLLAGAGKEMLSGRVIEVWQVRQLGLPLLADIDLAHDRQLGS